MVKFFLQSSQVGQMFIEMFCENDDPEGVADLLVHVIKLFLNLNVQTRRTGFSGRTNSLKHNCIVILLIGGIKTNGFFTI